MSKRSAVTGGTRFQYKEGPIALFVVLALAISMMVISAACNGDDKPANLPSKTYSVLNGITDCSKFSVDDAKNTLKSNDVNDSDATKISQAIDTSVKGVADCEGTVTAAKKRVNALSDKSNAVQVVTAITGGATTLDTTKMQLIADIDKALKTPAGQQNKSDLEALRKRVDDAVTQSDLDKVQKDINSKVVAILAAGGSTTPGTTTTTTAGSTPTGTPTPNADFEAVKKQLLDDLDSRIKDATGSLKTDLEALRKQVADQAKTTQQLYDAMKELTKKLQSSPSSTTTQPGSSTTTTPNNNGGGQTTMTKCGPLKWGPAGQAPGTGTSDSTKQVNEAVQLMQVDLKSVDYVTIHKFCPGDDTPNGWVVGSSWTEANNVNVKANYLPAGVCIDYDPGATQVTGHIYHTQVLNSQWSRTQIDEVGAASGLKFTVYWTPCAFTDGTPSWPGNGTTTAQPTVAATSTAGCPATAKDVATLTNTPESWSKLGDEPCAWLYNGTKTSFTVPQGYEADYDAGGYGGKKQAGESVPSGTVFTLRKK